MRRKAAHPKRGDDVAFARHGACSVKVQRNQGLAPPRGKARLFPVPSTTHAAMTFSARPADRDTSRRDTSRRDDSRSDIIPQPAD